MGHHNKDRGRHHGGHHGGGYAREEPRAPVSRMPPASQEMLCPRCQAENPATAKFCVDCGEGLRQLPTACRSCGTAVPVSSKFCPECGTMT